MSRKHDIPVCNCCEPGCPKCIAHLAAIEDDNARALAIHQEDERAENEDAARLDGNLDNDDGDEEDPNGTRVL